MKVWTSDNPDPLTVMDANVLGFITLWKSCKQLDTFMEVTVQTGKNKSEKLYLNPYQVTTIGD